MSQPELSGWSGDLEELKREFLNSAYGILAGLAIHDLRNASLQRPLKKFEESLNQLRKIYPARPIDLSIQDAVLALCGEKVQNHFSIVESQKLLKEFFEFSSLEAIILSPDLGMDQIGQFFSKWALHKSVHSRPKVFSGNFEGIELKHIDEEKIKLKLKSKQMLMSPNFALQRYFLLKKSVEDFFLGIAQNELKSQRALKRDILEMVEIGRIAPYNLVALSLIHPEIESGPMESAVGQSLSTALLAAAIARELEFTFRDQVNLGMIGLIYNVGLIGEATSLISKKEQLTPVEYKRVLDAQASGVYKLIQLQGASRPVLERLLAIFEYSKGPNAKSVSLSLESRLLKLVSQYVALTSDRPFREAYTPSEAIKILGSKAAQGGAELDPILYYLMVRFLGVYPVGSLVLLSNNEKAVVFRPSGEKPGRPMLKIVPKDENQTSALIDLGLEEGLSIIKALDPKREGIRLTGYFFD